MIFKIFLSCWITQHVHVHNLILMYVIHTSKRDATKNQDFHYQNSSFGIQNSNTEINIIPLIGGLVMGHFM